VHFINAYHESSGGIRTFYHHLAQAACAAGRHLHLVVPGAADDEHRLGETVRLSVVRAPRAPLVDRRYRLVLPHRFCFPNRGRIWRLLRAHPPDMVEIADKFSWCYLGGLVKGLWRGTGPSHPSRPLLVGRPMVVGFSHERLDDNLRAQVGDRASAGALASWYMNTVYVPQCDVHLANSQYTLAEVTRALEGLSRGSLARRAPMDVSRAVSLGVDARAWSPLRRRTHVRSAFATDTSVDDSVLLLYVGRLSKEKHVQVLPEVMARLATRDRRFRLVLVGSGPLEHDLAEHARALGNMHLVGQCEDRARLAELYASADLLLHPNPREPFGLAPLEAMASGLPVVVPAAGGVLSYASPRNAWLAANATADALADTVERAWDEVDERARRCLEARRTAETLDWTHVTRAIFAQYDDLYARFLRYETAQGFAVERRPDVPCQRSSQAPIA
jgi:alpha-1,6-mannosyltransferase